MKKTVELIESVIDKCVSRDNKFISVTGCGGKTSLIKILAKHYSSFCRVGVAASTKMYLPDDTWRLDGRPVPVITPDIMRDNSYEASEQNLIFYTDNILENGKIHGFNEEMQELSERECDIIFAESDGSAGRPLKGWADHEPVICSRTSLIIGILPLNVLGEEVSEKNVFRYDLFSSMTGLKYGDIIDEDVYVKSVSADHSLFGTDCCASASSQNARRLLFLNRCVNERQITAAESIAERCKEYCDHVISGSLYEDDP